MIVEIVISFFLVVSGLFGLVGSFGLIKLRDTMQRLHAPTKATTVGVGGVLVASMLYLALVEESFSFHEVMITLFLFLTAPITAHFMAQTHIRMRVDRNELPPTQRDFGWSLFDEPPEMDPAPTKDTAKDTAQGN
ncbi:Na+/H+ antiporter subunit G [Anianabacter salinae]|uniref:Na+/H+ antiporter subunit G n=1 Tax=Anianabacter salinae TaxID=2851023 RepID=UPI00225E273B|nr:Na+/H+ antiporter subunit G [Anianabacter salinae]MBV0910755.1 Na+/H+ antiporter subunit G [Anianabacter salinae]